VNEKTEKLSVKLANVQKNAEDSRRLIAYHKKMLKTYLRKEKALNERLKKEQLSDLYKTVRDGGCDIEAINAAIKNGEFGRDIPKEDKMSEPDEMAETASEHKEEE
jgi:hypothetical protein